MIQKLNDKLTVRSRYWCHLSSSGGEDWWMIWNRWVIMQIMQHKQRLVQSSSYSFCLTYLFFVHVCVCVSVCVCVCVCVVRGGGCQFLPGSPALFSSVQFSSRMVSMHLKWPISAAPRLSEVSPTSPLKQFQCSPDWQLPSLILSRKILFPCLSSSAYRPPSFSSNW